MMLAVSAVYVVPAIFPVLSSQAHISVDKLRKPEIYSNFFHEIKNNNHKTDSGYFEAYAALVTTILLFLTLLSAILGYLEASHTQSRSKTLDFISNQVRGQDIISMFKEFRELRVRIKSGERPLSIKCIDCYYRDGREGFNEEKEFEKTRAVFELCVKLLNYYEVWAIGIDNRALEERMLKDWWRTSLVADVTDLLSFVHAYRDATGVDQAFIEAQNLATKWAKRQERERIKAAETAYTAEKKEFALQKTLEAKTAKSAAGGARLWRRNRGLARVA